MTTPSSPPARKHFSMIRGFHLADVFTLGNAACGVGAVFFAMAFMRSQSLAHFYWAAALAPAAFIFDVLDGRIARADGASRWITGTRARAHGHIERAGHQAILVGRVTLDADAPKLDVRLPGLEGRSPQRLLLTRGRAPEGWTAVASPAALDSLDIDSVLVEGGAGAASAFLAADRVDRLLLYRAPILIGGGKPALGDIGLTDLADAHGRWRLADTRLLGSDRLDVYERVRRE